MDTHTHTCGVLLCAELVLRWLVEEEEGLTQTKTARLRPQEETAEVDAKPDLCTTCVCVRVCVCV